MRRKNKCVETYIPDLEGEIWKPVEGYEDAYHVSNMGRVKSLAREITHPTGTAWKKAKILSYKRRKQSAAQIMFRLDCESKTLSVARLVLNAFVGAPIGHANFALHKDGDSMNNRLDNLFWGTPAQNIENVYARGNGIEGSKSSSCRLTPTQVLEIRDKYVYGKNSVELSKEYLISKSHLLRIIKAEKWKHI